MKIRKNLSIILTVVVVGVVWSGWYVGRHPLHIPIIITAVWACILIDDMRKSKK
jgi:hypothetical protein